ncbi:AMP-binding protein [Nonomuraea longicatena]|uniref:AMP-dependent synthetase/ligase domain-containing protein n=1 Tax=Nonomuraea longicatena TaxID=83682 RepID=A0ABP3ZLK0_9ACTN
MKPILSSTRVVTGEVLGRARERGDRPALVDLHGGLVFGYRKLVTEVTGAASGLVCRGMRRDHVVGVHVRTTGAQTLAVHTVLAAGGLVVPLDPDLPAHELAGVLTRLDVRTLITTPDLARYALPAVESSRVRQVIAFGRMAAAVDFAELRTTAPTRLPGPDAAAPGALLLADGRVVTHAALLDRMAELGGRIRLGTDDVVLSTWRPDGGHDLIALVGAAVLSGSLLVAASVDVPGTMHDFGVTVITRPGGHLERR